VAGLNRRRTAVLISGRGSNLAALIDACRDAAFPASIELVISNKADASGLAVAAQAGIATQVIDHRGRSREDFEADLDAALRGASVDLVCLAGFMRLLTPGFVTPWYGRLINIHPSLLPAFRGIRVHEQALAAGVRISGCTVHFVRPAVDDGPIIAQAAVPVAADDTPETLAARILQAEHLVYPQALRWVASGQARIDGERVAIDRVTAPAGMLVSP
jgi:phosphoribosylglycinamide formyltransferase-1